MLLAWVCVRFCAVVSLEKHQNPLDFDYYDQQNWFKLFIIKWQSYFRFCFNTFFNECRVTFSFYQSDILMRVFIWLHRMIVIFRNKHKHTRTLLVTDCFHKLFISNKGVSIAKIREGKCSLAEIDILEKKLIFFQRSWYKKLWFGADLLAWK